MKQRLWINLQSLTSKMDVCFVHNCNQQLLGCKIQNLRKADERESTDNATESTNVTWTKAKFASFAN